MYKSSNVDPPQGCFVKQFLSSFGRRKGLFSHGDWFSTIRRFGLMTFIRRADKKQHAQRRAETVRFALHNAFFSCVRSTDNDNVNAITL